MLLCFAATVDAQQVCHVVAVGLVSSETTEVYKELFKMLKDGLLKLHCIDLACKLEVGMSDAADALHNAGSSEFPCAVWGNCFAWAR